MLTVAPRLTDASGPAATGLLWAARRALLAWVLALGGVVGLMPLGALAHNGSIMLSEVEIDRSDEGVLLSFSTRIELPRAVEDALIKGVPLQFEAEVNTYRSRWYWRDLRVATASLSWRITYQPLTRRYRVQSGAFSQQFESLHEALGTMQRTVGWKIADGSRLAAGERHYAELVFRLDTSVLPRPFQIGIGGQSHWDLSAQSVLVIPDRP
ncbi:MULTISPECIES: DUF4390 domain-containing protein [Caldimonas]|uniref:DUF4390 domain-containing protein n=1 Tax=Caldimonas TaxID=196013 RepID=UPI0003690526|nr:MULTISPECIES: DUF4390 domain-containing protein [Caldimonas]